MFLAKNIGTEFTIDKHAMIVMKKDNIVKIFNIEPPDGKDITSWQEGENYKYLGISVTDKPLTKKTKKRRLWESFGKLEKVLK